MLKKEKIFTKQRLKQANSYLNECKIEIYSIFVVFVLAVIFGFVFSEKLEFLIELLRKLILETKDYGGFEITAFIFQNNVGSAFFGMVFGIFFGIFPVFNAIINGSLLGFVAAKVIESGKILDLWMLIPHGVFELTAIFLALGMGLRLGKAVFLFKNRKRELKRRFYEGCNAFLLIIIPLLFLAAIIEGILIAFV